MHNAFQIMQTELRFLSHSTYTLGHKLESNTKLKFIIIFEEVHLT